MGNATPQGLSEEAASLYSALLNMSKSRVQLALPNDAILLMNRMLNGKLTDYLHELRTSGLIKYEINDVPTVTFLSQDSSQA